MDTEIIPLVIIAGAVLPLVTSAIKNPAHSDTRKRITALVDALVVAGVITGTEFGFDWQQAASHIDSLVVNFGGLWVIAQNAYAHLWKDTAIESRLAGEDPADVAEREEAERIRTAPQPPR